jgi:hypothetical protein
MSDLGHLQTCPAQNGMSASPLKADIAASGQHIRYGPFADSCTAANVGPASFSWLAASRPPSHSRP